jgi:hypothetical protein
MEAQKRNRAFLGILLFLFGGGAVLQAQVAVPFFKLRWTPISLPSVILFRKTR